MKRVLIGGAAYGWHNIGDDGLLMGILEDFQNFDCGILTRKCESILTEYPNASQFEIDELYHKPKTYSWYGSRKKISDWKKSLFPDVTPYKWSDVLICGGGTIFSACPWHAFKITQLQKKAGKSTIIWGAGMCDETDEERINLIRNWCNDDSVYHVYVRDELVMQRLLNIKVKPEKLSVCYDPAYVLEKRPYDVSVLPDKGKKMMRDNRKKMVLTLSGESDISNSVSIPFFKKFISEEIEKGFDIFIVPISYKKDIIFAKELEKTSNEHLCFIEKEFNPKCLIDFLGYMDISVSSRLHMSIYSALAGIPFISLKRNEKNSDLAKLYGMPCFSFDDLDIAQLQDSVDELLLKKEEYSKKIIKQAEFYKEQHKIIASKLSKELLNL